MDGFDIAQYIITMILVAVYQPQVRNIGKAGREEPVKALLTGAVVSALLLVIILLTSKTMGSMIAMLVLIMAVTGVGLASGASVIAGYVWLDTGKGSCCR